MITLKSEILFTLYQNKAENVLRQRNTFLTAYLTTLIAVFIPVLLALGYPELDQLMQLLKNSLTVIFLFSVIVTPVLLSLFWNAKYGEYKHNYMKILIRDIMDNEILISPETPDDYNGAGSFLKERTLFEKEEIMPILKELYGDIEDDQKNKWHNP